MEVTLLNKKVNYKLSEALEKDLENIVRNEDNFGFGALCFEIWLRYERLSEDEKNIETCYCNLCPLYNLIPEFYKEKSCKDLAEYVHYNFFRSREFVMELIENLKTMWD